MKKDKETLTRLYHDEKKTQDEIAEIYGVHRKTIGRWLREKNVPIKSRKEITREFNERHLLKYGVRTPSERKEVASKIKETNIKKYGSPSSLHGINQEQTKQSIVDSIGVENPSLLKLSDETRSILRDKESFESFLREADNTSSRIICQKLKISNATFNRYVKKYGLEDIVERQLSRGASLIENFLCHNEIPFEKEYTFKDCRGEKLPLPFDFFLKEHNVLIEFDGRQHYEPIEYWGGTSGFEKRKKYDKVKTNYSIKNKIELVRFNHLQSDEEIILKLKEIVKI